MTIEEVDAVLVANGWTEDKATTQVTITADETGVEAWRHHCRIARFLQGTGQNLKTSNVNAAAYMLAVFGVVTAGPPATLT